MIGRDIHNRLAFLRGVSPVTITDNTAQVSQIIDMADYVSLTFAIMLGTLADADATSALLMEEGEASDLSDATAVADADMLPSGTGQEAAAAPIFSDDNAVKLLSYVGTKRYVRLTLTPANNSGSWPNAILVIAEKRLQGTLN